jgi:3'-phosphoadenosine 5'-phosphosulfate sulfotransferase (PAPS reductase)/FAD synthetase
MTRKSDNMRHILALSGGKDSAALSVYLKDRVPNLEYVFLDTGHELPETYEYLDRMEAFLQIKISRLPRKKPQTDRFTSLLRIYHGCLPSPTNRWCTRQLKIEPFEKYIGNDLAYIYIALRADEDRMGYDPHSKNNIVPFYPFIEDGLVKKDVFQILEETDVGIPDYYKWRSRSGCYFCFFQRKEEWIALYDNHREYFQKACQFEECYDNLREPSFHYKNINSRKNNYTWSQGETLRELIARRDEILKKTALNVVKKTSSKEKKLLNSFKDLNFRIGQDSILENVRDEEMAKPCLMCK